MCCPRHQAFYPGCTAWHSSEGWAGCCHTMLYCEQTENLWCQALSSWQRGTVGFLCKNTAVDKLDFKIALGPGQPHWTTQIIKMNFRNGSSCFVLWAVHSHKVVCHENPKARMPQVLQDACIPLWRRGVQHLRGCKDGRGHPGCDSPWEVNRVVSTWTPEGFRGSCGEAVQS